jgi:hypothetical protein
MPSTPGGVSPGGRRLLHPEPIVPGEKHMTIIQIDDSPAFAGSSSGLCNFL